MKSIFAWRNIVAILSVAVLMSSACSNDNGGSAVEETSGFSPLTSNYMPIEAGAYWDFLRVERGVENANQDASLAYYSQDNPAGFTRWEIGEDAGQLIFNSITEDADTEQVALLEASMNSDGSSIEFLELTRVLWQDESSNIIFEDALPHGWLQFGSTKWTLLDLSYDSESMSIDYLGEEQGKVVLSGALGLEYERIIYDGSDQPGSTPYDGSDIDFDTYLDGVSRSRITGEVIAEMDFSFNSLMDFIPEIGDLLETYCPDLYGRTFNDCKWVRLALEADIFFSNQRDPNTQGGQDAINPEYLSGFAFTESVRRDVQLLLLAPDIGPLLVVHCVDLDKLLKVGDYDDPLFQFQPDVFRYDILMGSSTLP